MDAEAVDGRGAQYVGARVLRVEDPRLLTGQGRYLDDLELPSMVHAAFVRSTQPAALIRSIDVSAARELPGVVGVLTGADLAETCRPWTIESSRPEVVKTQREVLATERVRHVGQAVAVVVATSRYVAEDACELVVVDYEPLPAVVDPEEALAPGAPRVDPALESNDMGTVAGEGGDVEGVFAGAARVFSKRFAMQRHAGMPLEPRGVLASWEPGTGTLTVWSSTQIVHWVRTMLATTLGLPEGKVIVRTGDVGGGFGLKASAYTEEAIVPAIARLLGRPVKWVEDRYENLAGSSHTKDLISYVDVATDADGTFLGIRGRYVGNGGAFSTYPYTTFADAIAAGSLTPSLYRWQATRWEALAPLTNKCEIGTVRGIGWTPGLTAREILIDEIARELGVDPLDLRRRNIIPSEPYVSTLGQRYDGGSYVEALDMVAEMLGYGEVRERQRAWREQGRHLGVAVVPFIEPGGFGRKLAVANGFGDDGYFDAGRVAMEPDGSVVVATPLHSHGQSHETTLSQVVADRLGVRLEDIRYVQGDTSATPYGGGTWGSRSAVFGTGTLGRAAGEVAVALRALAGTLLEASADDVELVRGFATVRGAPQRRVPLSEVAAFGYFGGDRRPDGLREADALTATAEYDPHETYSNGAVGAILEVDVETGVVAIERIAAVHDCGTMLNPMVVEGQIAGAVVQGVGAALLEEVAYGADGQLLTASLMDYLYPTTLEVRALDVGHIETPSIVDGGVKGMGEGGTIATPAAVANAVADALAPLGVSIGATPLGPSQVLSLVWEARERAAAAGRPTP